MNAAVTRLLHLRDFRNYLAARSGNLLGTHMLNVVIGWQVYDLTGSALALGLVGLAQFAPVILLFPLTGLVADRVDRRRVLMLAYAVQALGAALFLANAMAATPQVWPIYTTLLLHGSARAFLNPATRALLPNLVPVEVFPNAVALSSTISKIAGLTGPVLGGALIAVIGMQVYGVVAALFLLGILGMARIAPRPLSAEERGPANVSLQVVFAGVRFIREKPILLGAISLDLFAVLFGTILGLLPLFARDILHVGPEGLGVLRAMPALGAVVVAFALAQAPPIRHAGRALFISLAGYSAAILMFGLSTAFWFSALTLLLYGGADMISIFIRQTLMQLATPNAMRGRVGAVDSMFTSGSEELGNARSGGMAALFGPVEAVVFGALATLAVAALWWSRFPELRQVDRLNQPL